MTNRKLPLRSAAFSNLKLSDDEFAIVSQIVADFAAEFQSANADWDAAANLANPSPSDYAAFRKRVRSIVDEAMAKFELGLGGQQSRALHGFIQTEKHNMRIAVED